MYKSQPCTSAWTWNTKLLNLHLTKINVKTTNILITNFWSYFSSCYWKFKGNKELSTVNWSVFEKQQVAIIFLQCEFSQNSSKRKDTDQCPVLMHMEKEQKHCRSIQTCVVQIFQDIWEKKIYRIGKKKNTEENLNLKFKHESFCFIFLGIDCENLCSTCTITVTFIAVLSKPQKNVSTVFFNDHKGKHR